MTRIFYCHPYYTILTGFATRINAAIQRVDRNKKLPVNLAGKSYCDTVESIKTKLSDVVST